ncbi:MAG: hypothetical protein Q4C30_00960 [Bacteroidia bacterium]|nr:hypothetical protein [Bacteroidia bacterium]
MKKKFLYLSAAAAMLSLGVTSCIDNDEPEGLRDLRQGQADKLRAEGEAAKILAQAEADKKKAEQAIDAANAALINAQVAAQEIANKLAEVKVEEEKVELAKKQLDLALAEAKNNAEIEKLQIQLTQQQAQLETAKAQLEAAKLNGEATILAAQTALDQAKQTAAQAAQSLAIQAAQLKDPSQSKELATARQNLVTKTTTFEQKSVALVSAQKALAQAVALAEKGEINDINIYTQKVQDAQDNIAYAELSIERAKLSIALAEKNLEEFKSVTVKEFEAWAADFVKYAEEYKQLSAENDALNAEIDKVVAADTIQLRSLNLALAEAEVAYRNAVTETYKELNDYKAQYQYYSFDISEALAEEFFNDYGSRYYDPYFSFNSSTGKLQSTSTISNQYLHDKFGYNLKWAIDSEVMDVDDIAKVEQRIEELNVQLVDLKTIADKDYADWEEKIAVFRELALEYRYSHENGRSFYFEEMYELVHTFWNRRLTNEDKPAEVAAKIKAFLGLRKQVDGFQNYDLENLVKSYTSANFDDLQEYLYINSTNDILGGSSLRSGGAHGAWMAASNKVFGWDNVYENFYDYDELYKGGSDLQNRYGSMGKFEYAAHYIADMEQRLANQAEWNALAATINNILDTYDAKVEELNKAIDVTKLNPFMEKSVAAEKAVEDFKKQVADELKPLNDQLHINNVKLTQAYNLQSAVTTLMNGIGIYNYDPIYYYSTWTTSATKAQIEYSVAIATQQLEQSVLNAKSTLLSAEQNLADKEAALAVAEKELEMVKAGTLTISVAIENAQQNVNNAKAAYDKAKAEYEALAAVDAILAIIKG